MLQVERIHVESVDQFGRVPDPHHGTIKVDQEPFVGIEIEGIRVFYSVQNRPIFRANERGSRVGCVDVKPEIFVLANRSKLCQIVESAG